MTLTRLTPALDCLAENGHLLRERFHYRWDRQVEEAVLALRFRLAGRSIRDGSLGAAARRQPLSLVGIVGGKDVGKSTRRIPRRLAGCLGIVEHVRRRCP